jgi:hydroxymethylpyrimidine pyrophosphatase-like HAD family hydrolase
LKISAIFSDYDGTLAPEDVPLEASGVPEEVRAPLLRLSSSVPVAVVTSKDYAFVRPRTPFARAWGCVSGLEIILSDGRSFAAPQTGSRLREGLEYVKRRNEFGLALELKRSTAKGLLAFSLDWRGKPAPPDGFIATALTDLSDMGLTVLYDPTRPFLDVFGRKPDKGGAVREMKRLLEVNGNVLFIGDSTADNSAFEEADLAICVDHGQSLGGLACGYSLRREELGRFFRSLEDDHLSLNLNTLTRK